MDFDVPPLAIGLCLVLALAGAVLVASRFTPEARTRRKRRRNYGRVIPRAKRPTVTLNVKPPKEPPPGD